MPGIWRTILVAALLASLLAPGGFCNAACRRQTRECCAGHVQAKRNCCSHTVDLARAFSPRDERALAAFPAEWSEAACAATIADETAFSPHAIPGGGPLIEPSPPLILRI